MDFEEARSSLIDLNLYTNDDDVKILFENLDVDSSGELSWQVINTYALMYGHHS